MRLVTSRVNLAPKEAAGADNQNVEKMNGLARPFRCFVSPTFSKRGESEPCFITGTGQFVDFAFFSPTGFHFDLFHTQHNEKGLHTLAQANQIHL